MLIKVSGQFLDFNDDIEIERKVKAFEEIDSVDGDFSYSFEVSKTSYNLELLGSPLPDTVKSFRKISAEILNDSGVSLYNGFLRVERITDVIECSFFAGNNEWFSDLTGDLLDIVDNNPRDFDGLGVVGSWDNTSGWFFPFADYGTWATRSHYTFTIEDFHPWYYLKDLVKKVLSDSNIKLTGDLINDWRYNHAIITSGIKQEQRIQELTVETDEDVSIAVSEVGGPEGLDSFLNNDYDVYVRVTATITMTGAAGDGIRLGLSGTNMAGLANSFKYEGGGDPISLDYSVVVPAGNTLVLFIEVMNTGGSMTVTHITAKFEPQFIYSFALNEILPKWSKVDLMINVFKIFNSIISYDPATKTITASLFDKIKSKAPIDLSDYLHSSSTDLVEFIQNYGQKSKLLYGDAALNTTYDNINEIPYGGGVIEVDNEYIEKEVDAVEIDLCTPKHGKVRILGGNFEHFEFSSYTTVISEDVTSVTNDAGDARLNMASVSNFIENQIIRVELDDDFYNGDWVVESVGVGYIKCFGMTYSGAATGTATVLRVERSNTDDAFICLAVADIPATDVSPVDFSTADIGYCYFNLLRTGRNIDEYKKSMSFGVVNTEGDYQQKLKDDYFNLFSKVLNDPVKLPCEMFLPEAVFKSITFQQPITLKSIDSSNMYFCNKISGYINSSKPCLVELIKL